MGFHGSFVGLLLVMSGPCWAFLGLCWAFGGCSWPIFANFIARKSISTLRSCCWGPIGAGLGAMLGLSQGPKLSMKRGYGVSWFICWALVGHVGTMLGLPGLMLSIWRMFVAYLCQLYSQKKHLNIKKLLLRSCCGRPWGHVGPRPQQDLNNNFLLLKCFYWHKVGKDRPRTSSKCST